MFSWNGNTEKESGKGVEKLSKGVREKSDSFTNMERKCLKALKNAFFKTCN